MYMKIHRVNVGRLMARDQLQFMAQHGDGLWSLKDGLMVFYYACREPLSVEHYVGALKLEEQLDGIPPAHFRTA